MTACSSLCPSPRAENGTSGQRQPRIPQIVARNNVPVSSTRPDIQHDSRTDQVVSLSFLSHRLESVEPGGQPNPGANHRLPACGLPPTDGCARFRLGDAGRRSCKLHTVRWWHCLCLTTTHKSLTLARASEFCSCDVCPCSERDIRFARVKRLSSIVWNHAVACKSQPIGKNAVK
ncbi:hypothetical protein SAMN06265222_1058 [Neorhodopirellula lusitana]|uniref:Uncharacterized protein n=1 Tax=Neorhodopirellula lusitana TaxID=445327 RepID=A0ABY1Q0I0_9BACT|nr:hypothetical protein SAMN06265222_1058 [Neorhodopirellula lusitana]